jgi:hypothetical protein
MDVPEMVLDAVPGVAGVAPVFQADVIPTPGANRSRQGP